MKYIIVGAGTFGASTALYLKREHPDAEVVLIDKQPYPNPSAAGHDLNKIVRSEYEDLLYTELASEALDIWMNNPKYKQYFHQTGVIFAWTPEPGEQIIANYKTLRGESPAVLLEPEEIKTRFGGIYRESDLTGVTSCTYNPVAGWADAEEALATIIQEAIDLGVEYEVQSISTVKLDDTGKCLGVSTMTGAEILADYTLLCTGANTAEMLANSAPDKPELQVGDRMVATAAAMCLFKVPEDQIEKFASAPVIISPTGDMAAESIPPGKKGLCKCTHELSFTNYEYHEASKQKISVPPKAMSRRTWSDDLPEGLKEETHKIAEKLFGSWVPGLEPQSYRMCWDAVTPNQDFVICPLPSAPGLFVAAGGSFHGWKFLTNIGKYIVQMLDGRLDEEKTKRWAWNRSDDGENSCAIYLPERDLKDIKGYVVG